MRISFRSIVATILSSLIAVDAVAKEHSNIGKTTNAARENDDQRHLNSQHHVSRKALISGRYRAGEIASKQMWFRPGQRLRVEWEAIPAVGNCIISAFSIFNAKLLFNFSIPVLDRPAWSEIAIETFGGSAGRIDREQFQTQYISQNDTNAPPTQRGTMHTEDHFLGVDDKVDIYDGHFHKFEIEFQAAGGSENANAEIIYRLDSNEIRRVQGGAADLLEPPLDIYARVWASSSQNQWACTADPTDGRQLSSRLELVTLFPLNINCGGPDVGSFLADKYFLSGNSYAKRNNAHRRSLSRC
jgi:hypothetical protein